MAFVKLFLNIIIIILSVILLLLIGLRFAGFIPFVIQSDSMSPLYEVNTLIFAKKVSFNKLNNYDVIVYINSNGNKVTHRIVEIDKDNKQVITKGDNNEFVDILPVDKDSIAGKVYFKIPYSDKIISKFKK